MTTTESGDRATCFGFSTEGFLWRVGVFALSGVVAGFSIAQAYYWNVIKQTSVSGISKKEADNMFVINVLLAVISMIVFLWSAYRLFFTRRARAQHRLLGENVGIGETKRSAPTSPPFSIRTRARAQ
jgi:heme/copper-type cytochrome/quinol oxidase subunit 2